MGAALVRSRAISPNCRSILGETSRVGARVVLVEQISDPRSFSLRIERLGQESDRCRLSSLDLPLRQVHVAKALDPRVASTLVADTACIRRAIRYTAARAFALRATSRNCALSTAPAATESPTAMANPERCHLRPNLAVATISPREPAPRQKQQRRFGPHQRAKPARARTAAKDWSGTPQPRGPSPHFRRASRSLHQNERRERRQKNHQRFSEHHRRIVRRERTQRREPQSQQCHTPPRRPGGASRAAISAITNTSQDPPPPAPTSPHA